MKINIPGTKMYRDTESMALVNTDVSGFNDYQKRRNIQISQRNEINKLKEEMVEIKSLIGILLGNKTNG